MTLTRRRFRVWLALAALTAAFSGHATVQAWPDETRAAAPAGEDLLAGDHFKKHWKTTGNWNQSEDGVVTLTPRPGEKGWTRYDAYLWLKDADYQDFEADFEYKCEKGGNSGFYFHVGDEKEPVATGVEVQIHDVRGVKEPGKLNDHDSGGVIPGIAPTAEAGKPAGEWNHFVITVKGDDLKIVLNDQVVNEVKLSHDKLKNRPKSGGIGFQDHGLPLSLRHFKIRKL